MAIAGFLVMTVSGAVWGSFTLFLVAIEQDTGWSKTSIALGFTVFTIAGACTAPVTGALVDRFGTRPVLSTLALVLALGLTLGSMSSEPLIFYLAFGVIGGFGSQSCGTYMLFTIAGNWFRRPATAMAFMDSGSGIGVLFALPILRAIMEASSWRTAYLALAGLSIVVIVPLAAIFLRLNPPGADPALTTDAHRRRRSPFGALHAIVRTPLFRWLALVHLLAPLTYHAIGSHQVAYLQHAGLTLEFAVWVVSTTGFTFFLSRLALGALIDWRGLALTGSIIAVTALAAVAALFAILLLDSREAAYSYPILFGLGFSSTGILFTAAARRLIDNASFTAIYGALRLVYGLGVAVGPPFMAMMVDVTGRFDLPFAVIVAVLVIHHAAFVWLVSRRHA